jgi:hypothetical protein
MTALPKILNCSSRPKNGQKLPAFPGAERTESLNRQHKSAVRAGHANSGRRGYLGLLRCENQFPN